jgi:membrane protease YdiL (CAAX protease family)
MRDNPWGPGLLKALAFVGVAIALLLATGPVAGFVAAAAGSPHVPVWAFAGTFSILLLLATALALKVDRARFSSLGLVPTVQRIQECALGFAVGATLSVAVALVRGAEVGVEWTFAGSTAMFDACFGVIVAFLLLFPEELIFRGYAFQRVVSAVGARPAILISALLFGVYHVVGSGMWGIGAFFRFAIPALGGVLFGWAAVRSKGLALPIGLHLGGNWVQASVLSLQSQPGARPATLWVGRVTDDQLQVLYAPEFSTHAPFMAAMIVATVAVWLAIRWRDRTTASSSLPI